jgi:hypothetical protein
MNNKPANYGLAAVLIVPLAVITSYFVALNIIETRNLGSLERALDLNLRYTAAAPSEKAEIRSDLIKAIDNASDSLWQYRWLPGHHDPFYEDLFLQSRKADIIKNEPR